MYQVPIHHQARQDRGIVHVIPHDNEDDTSRLSLETIHRYSTSSSSGVNSEEGRNDGIEVFENLVVPSPLTLNSTSDSDSSVSSALAMLSAIRKASASARDIGSAIVQQEAKAVKKRVMIMKGKNNANRKRRKLSDDVEECGLHHNEDTVDHQRVLHTEHDAEDQQGVGNFQQKTSPTAAYQDDYANEQFSVLQQACRTKRMAMLLKNMEVMEEMFMHELTSCVIDEQQLKIEGMS